MQTEEGGSMSGTGKDVAAQESPLIPGLPDDVAMCCLVRVPRKYHVKLRCVSSRWRQLVSSTDWLNYRQKCGTQETWIYALCKNRFDQVCCYVLDPSGKKRVWKAIWLFDDPLKRSGGIGFEVIGSRMYMLGGCSWTEDSSDEVYCFDTLINALSRVASLTTARCNFACESLNGKIYVIGGTSSPYKDSRSSETYDPVKNSWTSISHPDLFYYVQDSTIIDGKICIRGGADIFSPIQGAFYDTSSNTLHHLDSDLAAGLKGPAVVADGTLYVLDQTFGSKLTKWHKEGREWVPVGRLSPLLTRPPCRLVAIERTIYVIGRGLSTVIIDLNNVGNQAGAMVCTSIPNLDSHEDVLSCKCIVI